MHGYFYYFTLPKLDAMPLRCMIVDDEPLAIAVLEKYIAEIPDLQVVATCDNAIAAFETLRNMEVDLIFLDIEMPQLSGLDFVKTLEQPPSVIFTTAHRNYAFEGYELDAVDFLLKPISFGRFLKSVSKVHRIATPESSPSSATTEDAPLTFIYVKEDKKMIKVYLDEVQYIESRKDYVVIQSAQQSVSTKQQISYLEQKLPEDQFLRIHRSYIIALNKIKAFNHQEIELERGEVFPIGRSFKAATLAKLNKNEYEL